MKKALLLLPLLGMLTACLSPKTRQQQLVVYQDRCLDYGYKKGTRDFAHCMKEQEARDEELALKRRKVEALEEGNRIKRRTYDDDLKIKKKEAAARDVRVQQNIISNISPTTVYAPVVPYKSRRDEPQRPSVSEDSDDEGEIAQFVRTLANAIESQEEDETNNTYPAYDNNYQKAPAPIPLLETAYEQPQNDRMNNNVIVYGDNKIAASREPAIVVAAPSVNNICEESQKSSDNNKIYDSTYKVTGPVITVSQAGSTEIIQSVKNKNDIYDGTDDVYKKRNNMNDNNKVVVGYEDAESAEKDRKNAALGYSSSHQSGAYVQPQVYDTNNNDVPQSDPYGTHYQQDLYEAQSDKNTRKTDVYYPK